MATHAAKGASPSPAKLADAKPKNEKKTLLSKLEKEMQAEWEAKKLFEVDPPKEGEEDNGKFMATFPYPYMNGCLHLGHAFSLLKAEFAVSYHRLQGKRSLFPFGFHCTGMPIQAAANKLKRDYEQYGSPSPKFPSGRPVHVDDADDDIILEWAPPTSTGHQDITGYTLEVSSGAEWKEAVKVGPETVLVKDKKKVQTKATGPAEGEKLKFRVVTHLADGTSCHASAESDEVVKVVVKEDPKKPKGKAGAKKPAKIAAKSGDALHQWDIMMGMGISEEEITEFVDPMKWLTYFPPQGKEDLKMLGVHVDFRRSFITTAVNPYYDSFIRWQFNKLKAGNRLAFGKRPTVYSETDKQACMDHDRSEGEGGGPTEYTAIKVQVIEPLPECLAGVTTKPIYLLCGTLRPETMIGQTNCWILPSGTYGAFDRGEEVVICSDRAARNMSFQDLFPEWGKTTKVATMTGEQLMGASLKAPKTKYEKIHLLPLLTIKMDKGTGIVTSVPADSPDDYAAFMDVKKKPDYYKVKPEWTDFDLIPLIDVELDGENRTMCAEYLCQKLGVMSPKDTDKIQIAHDIAYNDGFYKGIMSAGEFKGMKVADAKVACKKVMIEAGEAFVYHEPDRLIKSRSGDTCVIALIDQWYLKYGEEGWRDEVIRHVENTLDAYTPACKKAFIDVLNWLTDWACSRSFGLGTMIPWDQQFVIESLSDSTIYMAYYTLAKYFHGDDNLRGEKPSPIGINPEDLSDAVFDYIFLRGAYPEGCKIPEEKLATMRGEFEYFYPMDLRVSGKDLIQNHLTMSLYNHSAIWENKPEMWPRSFYTNGWVLVDGEKMSKSLGNFKTLKGAIEEFGADATRLACASAGDTMEDANFEIATANNSILKLFAFHEYAQKVQTEELREGDLSLFADIWFDNEMARLMEEAKMHFDRMRYKEALRCAWFDFGSARSQYYDVIASLGQKAHKDLVNKWIEWTCIMMSIITPHTMEAVWKMLGKEGSVLDSRFPFATVNEEISAKGTYIEKVKSDLIEKHTKAAKKEPTNVNVYVAAGYPAWKLKVITMMKDCREADGSFPQGFMKMFDKKSLPEGDILVAKGKQVGQFAGMVKSQYEATGEAAFALELPFKELPLLQEYENYLMSKIKVGTSKMETMKFFMADDESAPDANVAENSVPGKPSMAFN
eukprot:TRINITY_DN3224_c0_g1_i1.p1 TRINITY_DN3224_c0_g1~~TRINITY_DN3224_c0_g1_i1.p1  ORF type:complete len:1186 (+),score=512.68 TRINITY_DN3224_c0_g1_i1:54-3560(+)